MEETQEEMRTAFEPGDVVRFHRGEYSHLGIYLGNRRVIHLWSPETNGHRVRVDSFDAIQTANGQVPENFSALMDEKIRANHGLYPLPAEEIVRRALSRIDETNYDVLTYNCEHFVTWARYDEHVSLQVASHTTQVLAGALLGGAVGGVPGFVVGGLISLFTKVEALSVSSAAVSSGAYDVIRGSQRTTETATQVDADELVAEARRERTRERRRRLWGDLATASREQKEEKMRKKAQEAQTRVYSEKIHFKLANRMAEENLKCG